MGTTTWDRLEPMPGKLVVRFDDPEEVSRGGIIIPELAKRNKDECEVLAVGAGKYDANGLFLEAPVRVGDRILSNVAWGKTYSYVEDDVKHRVVLLSFSDVIARVKKTGIGREEDC